MLRRSGMRGSFRRALIAVGVSMLVLGAAPAALGTSAGAATTVIQAQLEFIKQQKVLNKCLAASPKKNTPCIRRNAVKLAAIADRHIKQIRGALDGTEVACVVTVAQQEIAYERIWRDGARALNRNERKKARRLFVSSLPIGDAQAKIQPQCFTEVLAGGGG